MVTRTFLATWMLVVLATTGACHRSTAAAPAPTTRSPAEVSRDGNHLLGSGSAYLQMHAHNPVDWYPWGPEALTRARAESKPVFLSIGYASCHWCHVMAEEVFEKDDVAALLNARYVAIKVDREERPDLDRTYLRAVEAMTGSAGWPATLFLTEALEPFFGATYLDHDRFLDIARRGADAYAGSRSDVKRQVETLRARLKRDDAPSTGSAVSAPELHALAAEVVDHVDLVSGGFEGHTKFPTPVRWRFVLDAARKYGDSRFVTALRTTLDAMASAGLRDPLGGGFHRYATEPTWRVPHFEKMLYDNAQLADLYLEAGVALRETRYIEIGRETLDFLLREMATKDGVFAASFDADSDGREGAYYTWTPGQLRAALGERDAVVVADLLGITEHGPIDGACPPNRSAPIDGVAERASLTPAEVLALWSASRAKLVVARASRVAPRRDEKVVTSWNALVVSALARGFAATGDSRYRQAASRTAEALWRIARPAGGGVLRTPNGTRGVLDDYAFLARALLDVHEITGELATLERALALVDDVEARFAGAEGSWYLSEADADAPMGRPDSSEDGAEPSGNSAMVAGLIRLAALTGRDELRRRASVALASKAHEMRRAPLAMTGWLDTVLLDAGPFYEVTVAGSDAKAIDAAWQAVGAPWAVISHVGADGPSDAVAERMPTTRGKVSRSAPATAYVCLRGACKMPTSDAAVFRTQLLAGWSF